MDAEELTSSTGEDERGDAGGKTTEHGVSAAAVAADAMDSELGTSTITWQTHTQ